VKTRKTLTITKLNGLATFQDLGRTNAQHLGFSAGGAADEYSFLLANKLLDNKINSAAIEITLGQITFKFNGNCTVVLTGADCFAKVYRKELNLKLPEDLNTNQVINLFAGDELALSFPKKLVHSYLAIKGGFKSKNWLGSVSQTINDNLSDVIEPKLAVGSTLSFNPHTNTLVSKNLSTKKQKQLYFHQSELLTLRFIPSLLFNSFSEEIKGNFLTPSFEISTNSNRMGYRLKGVPVLIESQAHTLSKPVCFGTIQCPPDGQPIILMKDRQTIGGYPVLGTVMQTDLFRLSQKRPGNRVKFFPTTIEQAQAQLFGLKTQFAAN